MVQSVAFFHFDYGIGFMLSLHFIFAIK